MFLIDAYKLYNITKYEINKDKLSVPSGESDYTNIGLGNIAIEFG